MNEMKVHDRLIARCDADTERWMQIANHLMADHSQGDRGFARASAETTFSARCDWIPTTLDPSHVIIAVPVAEGSDTFNIVRLDRLRAAITDPTASIAEVAANMDDVWIL